MAQKFTQTPEHSKFAQSRPCPEGAPSASNGLGNPSSAADLQAWREAVSLWLRWNEAYEHLTERMFVERGDPQRIEALLDEADRLRIQAAEWSRELLGSGEAGR